MGIFNRIYSDYLLPSRLKEYDALLQKANANGYLHVTISQFYNLIQKGELSADQKYFIHRHDIDTDVPTARAMFEIEKKNGVKSSWYFRRSTIDIPLMREIHEYGSEVGYHYEELSDFCKKHRIKSVEKVKENYEKIRSLFKKNFLDLEEQCGFEIKSVASHGDFVNRHLGLPNHSFVNQDLLKELAVDFECYDEVLLKNYQNILSDTIYPSFYKPHNPFQLIDEGKIRIYLLSHPRHWRKAIWINTIDNIQRFIEGLRY
ncbi:MAG: hypothetical protein ACO3E1_08835 [Flavobacteriales bacterium]